MIHFDNVSKIYVDGKPVLSEVNFHVGPKEFVSIVGQSGAGKTTLIKLLLAEEKPSAGQVLFEDVNIHSLSRDELPHLRRRIGTVFQDFRLLPQKTAFENVAFAMEAAGREDAEIVSDVPQILDLVGLGDKALYFPRELSGGERQRVAIARAIVNKPDVIVADEPTGNLDPINSWEIMRLLLKINELGTTVVLATHDNDVINALERRVITLENGKIIRDEKQGKYDLS